MTRNESSTLALSRRNLLKTGAVGVGAFSVVPATTTGKRPTTQTVDVYGQVDNEDREVYAEDGAAITRTSNGVITSVSIPTPESGEYNYPEGAEEGHPEAFTLWVFVFDDPDDEAWTGAFLGAGHVVGGSQLTLNGQVTKQTDPFLGDHLENPQDAEVHLAVAPHGEVDPDELPDQIQTPSGGPPYWWLATFEPPE